MLELIVLGQIPGTNLYISFTAVAIGLFAALAIAYAGGRYIREYFEKIKK